MARQKKRMLNPVKSKVQALELPAARNTTFKVVMSALCGFRCVASRFASDVTRELVKHVRQIRVRKKQRLLRVCETVPLGEKRMIAVVDAGGQLLLVGGAANSVSLLTTLENTNDVGSMFYRLLQRCESRSSIIQ